MAPFLSHLVVGERVWLRLSAPRANQPSGEMRVPGEWFDHQDYGSFLFGCLAPDVDKFCAGLEQSTTHFLPKDEDNRFAWRRSAHFLNHTAECLRRPFCDLSSGEQAFVAGYLCHVATDEITARHAIRINGEMKAAGASTPPVDSVLTAMDPRLWALALCPEDLVAALSEASIPDGTLTFAPLDSLVAMHQIILPQVREGGGLVPYMNMVRRQWLWMRQERADGTMEDDGALEEALDGYRRRIEAGMPASEQLVGNEDLEAFVHESVGYSYQRICLLLDQECGE